MRPIIAEWTGASRPGTPRTSSEGFGARPASRVGSQQSPILRAGKREYRIDETQMQEKGIDKEFTTGYDELAEGAETIGNFNNEWDILLSFGTGSNSSKENKS